MIYIFKGTKGDITEIRNGYANLGIFPQDFSGTF